jgi:hypothetical protein
MDRRIALALTFLLLGSLPARGQSILTHADSASITLEQLKFLLAREASTAVSRIWIRTSEPLAIRREGSPPLVPMAPAVAEALRAAFPEARFTPDSNEQLFLCPAGVRVVMPGSGCPIKDDGVIVVLSPIRLVGDSVAARGTIIRSSGGSEPSRIGGSVSTWAVSCDLYFLRENASWKVVRDVCFET